MTTGSMLSISERLSVRERIKLTSRAYETLLDLNGRPHLLVAIELRGAHFPQLDSEPFVRVIDERGRGTRSWITRVAEDGSSITGYFPTDARLTGTLIEFGYGDGVFGRVEKFRPSIEKLDHRRLEVKPVIVTKDIIRRIAKLKTDQDPLEVVTQ